jgi:hypothetical protein
MKITDQGADVHPAKPHILLVYDTSPVSHEMLKRGTEEFSVSGVEGLNVHEITPKIEHCSTNKGPS